MSLTGRDIVHGLRATRNLNRNLLISLRPQSPSNEVADFVFSDVRHVPSTFLFLTANLLLGLIGG